MKYSCIFNRYIGIINYVDFLILPDMDYHIYNQLLSSRECLQNLLYSNHQLQPRCLH